MTVTIAMNSFINSANKVRSVHRGMAEACDPLLPEVPVDADIRTFDLDGTISSELFDGACRVRGVLMPVATKVLHRKRPGWIPMLDNVIPVRLSRSDRSSRDEGSFARRGDRC